MLSYNLTPANIATAKNKKLTTYLITLLPEEIIKLPLIINIKTATPAPIPKIIIGISILSVIAYKISSIRKKYTI